MSSNRHGSSHAKLLATVLVGLAVTACALAVTGCIGHSPDHSPAQSGAADAAFIADMTRHHQGAIDMAKLAGSKADHQEVKDLAASIIASQNGEISAMSEMRQQMHESGMHEQGHTGMSDAEMGMDMNMTELAASQPFDKAFIDAMVPHHQGAIVMATQLLETGTSPELQTMARAMVEAQTAEIAQMKKWRAEWYGAASPQPSGAVSSMESMGH